MHVLFYIYVIPSEIELNYAFQFDSIFMVFMYCINRKIDYPKFN